MKRIKEILQVKPKSAANASLVFLHGLGDSGDGWMSLLEELFHSGPELHGLKLICPSASEINVTLNGGYCMPAWYDIISLQKSHETDMKSIEESKLEIHDLIKAEIASGIPANRIILAGFSQGGALALHAGLQFPENLAGIVGLSSYLPSKESVSMDPNKTKIPIFLGHGSADPIVKYVWALESRDFLKSMNYNVTLRPYVGMEHTVCDRERLDILAFVKEVLANGQSKA